MKKITNIHTPSNSNRSTQAASAAERRRVEKMDQRTLRIKAGCNGTHHDRTTTKY
jgi:hypothetical protein